MTLFTRLIVLAVEFIPFTPLVSIWPGYIFRWSIFAQSTFLIPKVFSRANAHTLIIIYSKCAFFANNASIRWIFTESTVLMAFYASRRIGGAIEARGALAVAVWVEKRGGRVTLRVAVEWGGAGARGTTKVTGGTRSVIGVQRTGWETFISCTLSWELDTRAEFTRSYAVLTEMRRNSLFLGAQPIDILADCKWPDYSLKVFPNLNLISTTFYIPSLNFFNL